MSTTEASEGATPAARASAAPRPTVTAVGLHGTIGVFDPALEEWSEYSERLVHYFVANDIVADDKRRAVFLTVVGPATYRLLKTLASPQKLDEFEFSQLVDLAMSHYNPKPSPIVKRFEFNSRCQREGESIAAYVAEVRKIAEHCQFGTVLNDMLRDRLVCGTRNKVIQRRLLVETSLTFDKAIEMALAAEAAEKDSLRLSGATTKDNDQTTPVQPPPTPVHKVGQQKPQVNPRNNSPPGNRSKCYRCGGGHLASVCPCREFVCHFCKKKGHLAKVCRKKGKANKSKSEQANAVTDDEGEEAMHHVKFRSNKPYRVVVNVNGNSLSMEIDTGASVSVVGKETFETIRVGVSTLKLQKTSVHLKTYTGQSVAVLGSALVPVEHNGQALNLPLVVTEAEGPPLLGRDWLAALRLDWKTIFTVSTTLTLQQVLEKYSGVFKEGLGEFRDAKAKIYVDKDVKPQFYSPRQVPFAIRHKVEDELDRLQALGVIRPVQFSDWAAPIVPVLKRDGRVRICGDYKITVNRAAKVEKYPIPRIEELFASLAGGQSFTKLDLSRAYLQIPLEKDSHRYVTINTHKGLFEYLRLPFGVSSAPSIFQRTMENLLQGISGVCVYLDDILITGPSEGEHLSNLAQVLQRLESAGMRLKKEKCKFMLPSVSYLGHVISSEGLRTDEAKVRAIVEAPEPRNVGELRSFLGMVNYYGKFLPDLATALAPLYQLLQKSTHWCWRQKHRNAFKHVKDLLHSGRVLVHFDDSLPLVLACDASPYGLGAVLSHKMPDGEEKPVGFASRTLSKSESNYSHLDKEALAIMYGVKKFHQYVFGRHFFIKTDHKPLTHIFSETKATPTMASGRIQRWALTLGGYDYSIQYREGKNMANADALSRLPLMTSTQQEVPQPPELVHLVEFLDSTPLSCTQIRVWTDHDPTLSRVRKWVQEGWPAQACTDEDLQPYVRRKDELSTEGGCVLWGIRVILPDRGRKRALDLLHEAHPGIVRMKSLARGYMWWPGMNKEIEQCVEACPTCQATRKMPPTAPLHPWTRPSKPWSRIHVDYAGPLENKMFLIIVDAYSKWMEVHATSSSTSATTIELLRKSFASLGLPEVLVSDNATTFTSEEFAEFTKKNGIRHVRSPPYHPSSNGLAERAVQTVKEGLMRCKAGSLETRLSKFLLRYRITPHSSVGSSPAELMWGRTLRSKLDLLRPDIEQRAQQAADRQKMAHDSHSFQRQFAVNETVYARNYGSGPRWLSGTVVGLQGTAMYRVRLLDNREIVRHIDQLRPRVSSGETESSRETGVGDTWTTGGATNTQTGEPESAEAGPTSVEASGAQPQPPAEETGDSDQTTDDPPAEPPDTQDGSGERTPTSDVRRSTRTRQPPARYEEQFV